MKLIFIPIAALGLILGAAFTWKTISSPSTSLTSVTNETDEPENQIESSMSEHPLSIPFMRNQKYPGSDLVIEQTLPAGSNYSRSIVSYQSEGLKIYALLTIPRGEKPTTGWPVIIFNHGYIPPTQYRTTERYLAYTDAFFQKRIYTTKT